VDPHTPFHTQSSLTLLWLFFEIVDINHGGGHLERHHLLEDVSLGLVLRVPSRQRKTSVNCADTLSYRAHDLVTANMFAC